MTDRETLHHALTLVIGFLDEVGTNLASGNNVDAVAADCRTMAAKLRIILEVLSAPTKS